MVPWLELLENGISGKNHAHNAAMMSIIENGTTRQSHADSADMLEMLEV